MLHEAPAIYKKQAENFDDEEVLLRGGVFKKLIPQVYNNTCCISGMRIIASQEVQMIDACHIIPFSESHDDTISNGLSMCPNLHRAFDRGLISIDENYRVMVSGSFIEDRDAYTIKNFMSNPNELPLNKIYLPSVANLQWHQIDKFIV